MVWNGEFKINDSLSIVSWPLLHTKFTYSLCSFERICYISYAPFGKNAHIWNNRLSSRELINLSLIKNEYKIQRDTTW